MALWVKAEVLIHFTQSGCFNVHIFEGLEGHMWECGHNQSACQFHIKVKVLWAQCVYVTNHNCWSEAAHRSMLIMWQLDHILTP